MKSTKLMLATAAMGGLLAGAAMNVSASTATSSQKAAIRAQVGSKAAAIALEKHDCKGMNSCKGQGGCKTGDNGCKGKNSCKGNGGCKVAELL